MQLSKKIINFTSYRIYFFISQIEEVKKESPVWDKYEKLNDTYAICKACRKQFKRRDSTSNLYQHLRHCR